MTSITSLHPDFVHLRVRSALSLLGSMITVKSLGKWAIEKSAPAIAVTDDNNLFGALEASETLAENGVQPIVGITLSIYDENDPLAPPNELALLAQNEAGYLNLLSLSTKGFLEPAEGGTGVFLKDILQHSDGLICLTGGGNGEVTRLCANGKIDAAREHLITLSEAFGDRLYVELQRHGRPDEINGEEALVDLAYELDLPLVATNDSRFFKRENHRAHDALLCIANSAYLSQEDRPQASPEQYLKSPQEMVELFSDLPEAISNTTEIAKRVRYVRHGANPSCLILRVKKVVTKPPNWKGKPKKVCARVWTKVRFMLTKRNTGSAWTMSLDIIKQMGFPGYFLIVSDFIKWAKAHDIPVGPGRGSGAGSLVAWVLTITDLDPLAVWFAF